MVRRPSHPELPARLVTAYAAEAGLLPVVTSNGRGFPMLVEHEGGFFLRGEKADELGTQHSFLEHVSFTTGQRRVIWEGGGEGRATLVDLLRPDASVLLVREETDSTPPNYAVRTWRGRDVWHLTDFKGETPLADARVVRLAYQRDDGADLAASLYLPPDYDSSRPLPLMIWAYPRQVTVGAATRIEDSKAEFMSFERAFRLFYLLRGYAVLDDVSMPIIGTEGDANDAFVQQVVMNAAAAVNAAVATGFVDPSRVGVAGGGYGAFMVANLLAHSRLFAAGVALSGAYNRTLTPFGFQTERRTLWQAQKTYLAMSPLLYSDHIKAPLLLVHGLKDDNAGTSPLQSVQFYQAIRGNGGNVELLLLPWEGHSYRGRESVFKTAAYMLRWFDEHLKGAPADGELPPP